MSAPAAWKFSTPSAPSKIVIKLDFFTPFEAHNTAEFTMLPQGDATNVTWAMHGPAPFMSKVMQVFMNIDNMIGKDFEAGLANLKTADREISRRPTPSITKEQAMQVNPYLFYNGNCEAAFKFYEKVLGAQDRGDAALRRAGRPTCRFRRSGRRRSCTPGYRSTARC